MEIVAANTLPSIRKLWLEKYDKNQEHQAEMKVLIAQGFATKNDQGQLKSNLNEESTEEETGMMTHRQAKK